MVPVEPIACDLHDQIEVACLYRYQIEVLQRDGITTSGQALTTRTDSGVDYLIVSNGSKNHEIPMHQIALITVLTPNARFARLTF